MVANFLRPQEVIGRAWVWPLIWCRGSRLQCDAFCVFLYLLKGQSTWIWARNRTAPKRAPKAWGLTSLLQRRLIPTSQRSFWSKRVPKRAGWAALGDLSSRLRMEAGELFAQIMTKHLKLCAKVYILNIASKARMCVLFSNVCSSVQLGGCAVDRQVQSSMCKWTYWQYPPSEQTAQVSAHKRQTRFSTNVDLSSMDTSIFFSWLTRWKRWINCNENRIMEQIKNEEKSRGSICTQGKVGFPVEGMKI